MILYYWCNRMIPLPWLLKRMLRIIGVPCGLMASTITLGNELDISIISLTLSRSLLFCWTKGGLWAKRAKPPLASTLTCIYVLNCRIPPRPCKDRKLKMIVEAFMRYDGKQMSPLRHRRYSRIETLSGNKNICTMERYNCICSDYNTYLYSKWTNA